MTQKIDHWLDLVFALMLIGIVVLVVIASIGLLFEVTGNEIVDANTDMAPISTVLFWTLIKKCPEGTELEYAALASRMPPVPARIVCTYR